MPPRPALTLACALLAAPLLAATPATAAAKPVLPGCYDGKCQFTFTKPMKFKVAKKYGLSWVSVAKVWSDWAGQDMVQVSGPGTTVLLSENGRGATNSLNFRILDITTQGAKIRFTG